MTSHTIPMHTIGEDIVISGMSGRYPESDTTDEFAQNLYNNVDMITEDNRRWPTGLFGMNPRMGKIKNIEKFDGMFFGILNQMGDRIDPQSRILLETTYECIVDAGINPQTLRGSDTGVYIGWSSFGMPDGVPEDVHPDSQNTMSETLLWLQGHAKCLYSNRVSFVFDFKGPSLVIDTACSSSLVAFNTAMNDLRLGKCRQAIVGGTELCLQAFTNQIFQSTKLNSSDGIPKVWDESANGFVRGETICCFLLQRKSDSKRIYATVLNSGVNIDGNKRMGMFFPSSESQEELMIQVYKEVNVDPLKINYFEAHATGTKVGDPQEAKAIYNAFCAKPNRKEPLPMGLLKSSIGHAEGASGVSSVTKVLLAYENECLPKNLHLINLKNSIKPFSPPLMPVQENTKYTPGIAGVNNFGVGGVNAHVLLEPNYKTNSEDSFKIADEIPRIVNICCRNEQALNEMFSWIQNNPNKISRDFLALLAETMRVNPAINSSGFPYRGSLIIKKIDENQYEYKKQSTTFTLKSSRPLYFLFPGLGGQWVGMAKALMPIKSFAARIEECHQILEPLGINLKHLLLSDDKNSMSSMTNKFCATTAIEIALMDIIRDLGITPDGIMGHSFGEIAAAYADGCLTAKEALLVTYYRGVVTESDKKIPRGLMAVVGLSWSEVKKMCPKGTSVVCNNGKETVVISGLERETKELVETLNKKGVFVRELQSHGIPYHSEYLMTAAKKLTEELRKCVPNPRQRSKKFISTALLDMDVEDNLKTASAEYFVHNLISPVYFYNKFKHIPSDAIVLEIGPHGLFSKVVKETLEAGTYVSLMKKDSNETNLDMFMASIAKLYELGLNPLIENLYPKVEWPVARSTQSISSLVKWDHTDSHAYRKYPESFFRPTASDMNETINLGQILKSFLPEHCIDGNILYPATGYLMLAWRRMAATYAKRWNEVPVIFEDVQFRRAIFLSETETVKIKVKYHEQTGDFCIYESGNLCCVGKVRTSDEYCLSVQHLVIDQNNKKDFEVVLTASDIYKDLKILGYDYGPKFRKLKSLKTNDFETLHGDVGWDGNWITFMDSLLQVMALALPFRKMMVPVMIKALRCDPKTLYEALDVNRLTEVKEIEATETNIMDIADRGLIQTMDKQDVDDIFHNQNVDYVEEMFGREYHIYDSYLPYFVDMNSRMIITPGVEIEDLMAFPIPRKTNTTDLKLESYEFLPNDCSNAIDDSERKALLEYIKVCSSVANRIKEKLGLKDRITGVDVNEKLANKYLIDIKDEHILLKLLNELLKGCVDENQNVDTNQLLNSLINKPEFDLSLDLINQVSKNEQLVRSLLDIVSESIVPRKEIKVLEINQNIGLMAEEVDNDLASATIYPIDVNYTVAVKSLDTVPEKFRNKSFKIVEWKASTTSVFPSDVTTTDLIVFKDSYDLWQLDTERHLQESYDSLVNKGFLLSVFRYQLTEPEMALTQMNGKRDLKNSDFEKRIADYVTAAKNVGFSQICRKSDSIGSMSLLFRKVMVKQNNPKNDNIIEIKSNSVKWFESLKEKMNQMKESEEREDNIWLIANDSERNGIIGLINCLRLEPGGEAIRCLFDCDKITKLPIDFDTKPFFDILENDLPINVLKNGQIGSYRHLTLPKNYDKTESDEYFLNISGTRDLSGLQWFDMRSLVAPKTLYSLTNTVNKLVKINVYTAGLNFRDVMLATGRIASGPQALFTDCLIGFEFAGRRADTGERVIGFDISRCFATHVDSKEHLISKIPDCWTMDEAVTILCTYSTVWYGLLERANMQRGEKILIHSGAGGVGQSAISVCQYYGCDIYVTVGTDDKKKFLMEKFNIPENKIFSSRNIQFKYKIKELTKGKGVDLVLNSLTGDKLDASYECVADCGRFVEIGKYDLQMNKQLGMFSFLRDISFIGVSVDQQLYLKDKFAQKFFDWMHENATNGMIRPITRNLYRAEDAEKAFRYMTTGKHIGKILLKIREEEHQKHLKSNFNKQNTMTVSVKTYFDPSKVYIITGGLGGFGLEFIHWMLFLGARNFILTSRFGIKSDYQKFVLDRLDSMGHRFKYFEPKIVVSTNDTNTTEGAKKLISDAQKMGQIGGIFHLSLVLNDCLLENQTIDKFCETIDSKTKTFENLDRLSRELNLNLDYFVVFSSVACGKGNAGQSNYGYANSICERICEARFRDGLKGLAIQWGPIGDVGVLADSEINTSLAAIVKQRINSCLEIMDKLLQTNKPIVSCVIRAQRLLMTGTKESKLVHQLWQALGIDPKTTPNHLTLGEIGMESMFAVELQQGLEREYDIKVTLNDIKNITIGMMKEFESGKVEEMKLYANEIKDCRTKLSKIKFIIPSDAYTRLNSVKTGKPVYFLPPLEGIFASLEALAEKINRPVIGLNWTKDMEGMVSLKDISRYYTNLMKELEPKGNYDIVGHFYGALIAMKMIKTAPIGKAVIIDMLSEIKIDEDMITDDYLMDLILAFISKDLPAVVRAKLKRDIQLKPDVPSKLSKINDELKEFVGKGLVGRDLEEILNNSFKRAKLFTTYRLNMKKKFKQVKFTVGKKYLEMSGKLLIIKPFEMNATEPVGEMTDKIKSAYFLPEKGMEGKLNFEAVDAKNIENPNAIEIFELISDNINKYLN